MKAKYLDELGLQVQIEHDDGRIESFPTTENSHLPWVTLRGKIARGEVTVEPYTEPKKLSKVQRKKMGLPT